MNIRLAGFGGQGIVMAGYALGHAGILDGQNALQTQSYGSEARGGASKSDVIISEQQILDLAPSNLDVLVVMAQPALEKHLPFLSNDGTLIYDDGLVTLSNSRVHALGLPATQIAHQTFGRDVVANVIMLGAVVGLTRIVSPDSLRKAISESVPPKTVDMNLEAFDMGFKRGADQQFICED